MKRAIFIIILFFTIFISGCQAQAQAQEIGTLQVNVSWQTDVWKPGDASKLVLPDTEVRVHKIFSKEVLRSGITDLLGVYLDESISTGWYWVEAVHQPEGVMESDYGKHWVAHMVHVRSDQTTVVEFNFNNAGGWILY
ncbi:MAG: hypothetical protein JEZ00_17720 [Anaerolineaceae bacterium]|nr:hypothetical protein [Anaerolineaceae bacterium]